MARPIIPATLLCLALLTSACGTALRGTAEEVAFRSQPAGAVMTTTTGRSCVTPCEMVIPRKETFKATFELDGDTRTVAVDTEISDEVAASTATNVLILPFVVSPIAIIVDAASGANLDHTPNPVTVSFAEPPGAAPLADAITARAVPPARFPRPVVAPNTAARH